MMFYAVLDKITNLPLSMTFLVIYSNIGIIGEFPIDIQL